MPTGSSDNTHYWGYVLTPNIGKITRILMKKEEEEERKTKFVAVRLPAFKGLCLLYFSFS